MDAFRRSQPHHRYPLVPKPSRRSADEPKDHLSASDRRRGYRRFGQGRASRWDRLGDGHISFAVQFQTPDLLNFVWTTLSATQPRIRDLLMAKIDQLITSGAEPKQWLEMFSRSPHLISMLVILHQSGTSTLNQIDYLDDPRILPSLDLRDFEVMWQVGQLSSFAFIQYFALRPFRRRSYKPSFNSTAEPSHCPGCFRTEAGLWRCSSSTIGN
jgi:hypothetical protein